MSVAARAVASGSAATSGCTTQMSSHSAAEVVTARASDLRRARRTGRGSCTGLASLLAFELRDTTLEASDLLLGAHPTPAERSRNGELAVQLVKLTACSIELGVRWRFHRR